MKLTEAQQKQLDASVKAEAERKKKRGEAMSKIKMTEDQKRRFDAVVMEEAKRKGGLTIQDLFIIKEAFWSCEIEREEPQTELVTRPDTDPPKVKKSGPYQDVYMSYNKRKKEEREKQKKEEKE